MAFNVEEIKDKFNLQGARPTLFNVYITFPDGGLDLDDMQFVVSATSIPESRLGNIPVLYFGRAVNFAGDRTYDPWTVNVMNDENFKVRNSLETWSNLINAKERNIRDATNYKGVATVNQYSKTGELLRSYSLIGIYPSVIEPIRLGWDLRDQFENFQVQFTYDYWVVDGGKTGDGGGL